MSYKLYTDKNENFECEVSVKNASLKGSMARLVVESAEGINLIFKGNIENGKCIVPVRRLKGLLDENSGGNMFLELIVEDTYFKPWQSDFAVEEHTSIKVKVNDQKTPSKPIVEVKVPTKGKTVMNENKEMGIMIPLQELTKLCDKFGITKKTLAEKKDDFRQIVQEYFKSSPEFQKNKKTILNGLKHFLK